MASEPGSDRTCLPVAGGQQKRWRATIALHANDEETRLGLRQFDCSVQPHVAARMGSRVDELRKTPWALEYRVQIEPEFAQNRMVGPEAGRGNNLVDDDALPLRRRGAMNDDGIGAVPFNSVDREGSKHFETSRLDQGLQPGSQRSALGKKIGCPPEQGVVALAQRPIYLRPLVLLDQRAATEQIAESRVAAAGDEYSLAEVTIAVRAQDVRHA